ncbi:terminase small subunit [Pigmentiphaga kullae]|uniref:terminase small subunit n=1 Tax=Pigmentiphaga kullae TaxID=151784 RepID=UPI00102BDC1A|nr:terminase small subunit [Pigmentiphaga kullae]
MALTPRKRAFVEAKGRGLSNKDAAIAAGYSAATASAAGSRLVKDPDVVKAMAEALPSPAARGFTAPDGRKTPDAPEGWAFGIQPPVAPPPPQSPASEPNLFDDPLDYIKHVVNDPSAEPKERLDAAKAWATYVHAKKAPAGKKAGREEAAAAAMGGGADAATPNPFAPRRGLKAVK